jgi:hypothetical protein
MSDLTDGAVTVILTVSMAQENQGIQANQGTLSERVEGFSREIQSTIEMKN